MTKEELATERNEVREILEGFSEELSQSNLDKLSRVFCIINGDEKRIAELEAENEQIKNSDTLCKIIGEQKRKITELEAQIEKMMCCYNCKHSRTEYEHCKTDEHEKWEIKGK